MSLSPFPFPADKTPLPLTASQKKEKIPLSLFLLPRGKLSVKPKTVCIEDSGRSWACHKIQEGVSSEGLALPHVPVRGLGQRVCITGVHGGAEGGSSCKIHSNDAYGAEDMRGEKERRGEERGRMSMQGSK